MMGLGRFYDVTFEPLSASHHPRECLGRDKNSAVHIARTFSVVSIARNLLNQLTIGLEDHAISSGQV